MQAKDLLVTGDVRVVGDIYSPSLDFTPTLTSGTQVGTIRMNGKTTNIYAPAGGGSATGAAANYTLAKSGNKIQLKKDGTLVSEVIDDNTTYTIPTVPTVNNGTLTIQRNGSNVATFTANQSGNVTANISVPTKYSDLTGLPTIPSVGNGTLTIQKNGTTVTAFSANQSGNATANITVPTKVSELTNDSGYKTTDNNTTYTFATGDSNGQFKVTPSGGSAQNVSIKGLGSAAYTASTAYAPSGHTHNYAGSSSAGGSATSAVKLDGGAYIVASSSEPTNSNCLMWIKTS